MDYCVVCGGELSKYETDICDSCRRVMQIKYPETKCLEEQIECHKRHAKKLRR